jgi:hypothetical protein
VLSSNTPDPEETVTTIPSKIPEVFKTDIIGVFVDNVAWIPSMELGDLKPSLYLLNENLCPVFDVSEKLKLYIFPEYRVRFGDN